MKRSYVLYLCLTLVASIALMGCPPDEARMNVSVNNLHFGVDVDNGTYETEKNFVIENTGGSDTSLVFEIAPDQPWINVAPQNGNIAGGNEMTIRVTIDRNYTETKALDFAEGALTIEATNQKHTVGVTTAPDYYTEVFDADEFDLEGKHLWLTPAGGPSYYMIQTEEVEGGFPTDPAGGLLLDFELFGDPEMLVPRGNATVPFYGQHYDTLYVASGGWVSFGEPGNNPDSLDDHFAAPQLSALPLDAFNQGMVSVLQDDEKLIITYEDVPSKDELNVTNDIQIELYFDGRIRVTYLNVDPMTSGVVGLSVGAGQEPEDFLESTLNTNPISAKLN